VALTHEMGQQQRCGRIPGRDDGFRCLGADQWCHWGVEGTLGCLDGRNHAETKDLPMGKNDSALESLAGREKTGREGAAGGVLLAATRRDVWHNFEMGPSGRHWVWWRQKVSGTARYCVV
jgi:hypothetical protein